MGGGHLGRHRVLRWGGDGTWLQSYVVVMNRMQLGAKELYGFLTKWEEGRTRLMELFLSNNKKIKIKREP
jgi:hypothetical protein